MSDGLQEDLERFKHINLDSDKLNFALSEETMERIKKAFLSRADIAPIIPPEHIVKGDCTLAELNRYLTINKFEHIRAIEAAQMLTWLAPLAQAMNGDMPPDFSLRDILGNNPDK